jgi:hypothetical protein
MAKIDNAWIIVIVILVALVLLWKPIMLAFRATADKMTNKEQYERGKAVFYDMTRWAGPDSYCGCAACHAPDFKPEEGKEIKMVRYKPGQPVILKHLSQKYGGGIMGGGEDLYEQVVTCLSAPDKMACGRVSIEASFMQDLLVYLNKQ